MEITEIKDLVNQGNNLLIQYTEKKDNYNRVKREYTKISDEIENFTEIYNKYRQASEIIGQLSENTVNNMLHSIEKIINEALAVIFKNNVRKIEIAYSIYRQQYPHFDVKLYTENGTERSFRQNGAGLAQIVSFLAEICIIDAKGCRKLLIMDEILNGVHPEALECIYAIMESVSDRFQFICVEYGFDIGKQILVENNNDNAKLTELNEPYYKNCYQKLSDIINE